MDLVLGRDGKNKGERLNDAVISKRQAYLASLADYDRVEQERFAAERRRDKAEDAFKIALKAFDEYYGVKK